MSDVGPTALALVRGAAGQRVVHAGDQLVDLDLAVPVAVRATRRTGSGNRDRDRSGSASRAAPISSFIEAQSSSSGSACQVFVTVRGLIVSSTVWPSIVNGRVVVGTTSLELG